MAVSPISTYVTDSSKVDASVQHLLGEGSIAKQKSQCARQLEFLGWIFDLDTRTITLTSTQVPPCTFLFRYKQKGINSTDPTSCIISFPHVTSQQTHATLHSRVTRHHKRVFSAAHQNRTKIAGSNRHHHVAQFRLTPGRPTHQALRQHGVLPTASPAILFQIRRVFDTNSRGGLRVRQ